MPKALSVCMSEPQRTVETRLTIVQPRGPHAKLKAVISMMTNDMMTLPKVGLTSPPGIPKQPTMKIEMVMIAVVVSKSGRRGILLAKSTAMKTVTICMRKTMTVIKKGSFRPIALEKTVPK